MGKRSICLALSLLLIPAGVWADRHKAGFRVAYADAKRSSLKGIQIGGEWELHRDSPCDHCPKVLCVPPKEPCPPAEDSRPTTTFSIVGELTLVNGNHEEQTKLTEFTLTQFTALAGPRASFFHGPVQPFAHALAGFSRLSEGDVRTPPAFAFGVGVDIPLGSADKHKHPRIAFRAEVDWYYVRADAPDWFPQYSVGLAVRFNRPPK